MYKVFCHNCNKVTEFEIIQEPDSDYKGQYKSWIAKCLVCNNIEKCNQL